MPTKPPPVPTIASVDETNGTLTIVAADGNKVVITPMRVLAYQSSLRGSNSTMRQMAVQNWITQTIVNQLGLSNLDPSQVRVNYDPTTGQITTLNFFP